MEQSVPISSNTFWGTTILGPPIFKNGSLKLQKGAHLTLIGQSLPFFCLQNRTKYEYPPVPEGRVIQTILHILV